MGRGMFDRSRDHHSGRLRRRNNTEPNPTGTICLPVRFADKTKSRSLEVDFLIVDVPTAYNIRPDTFRLETLKGTPIPQAWHSTKSKIENEINTNKTKGVGTTCQALHHRHAFLLEKRRLQLLGGRDKLDHRRVAALSNGLLALIHKAMTRLEGLVIFKLTGKGQHDPAEIPEGVGAALLGHWYRETSPSSHRHSVTAFTPRAKTSTIAISSSVTLGESKAPGAAKFQDLTMSWTRESLTPGSTLMKLAEGRGVSGEAPLVARVVTPAGFEGVRCSCLAGVRSPDDQRPN
ncbi:hypothetical protein Cgig2_031582 [Carnegiea gigantea]|uniref:Uncharacterized protein n=1 Tax=Carnegiea gigantea TaxID=171969 RepID=A0A9Q1JLL3_9CARY|nr:hypothetical protein Cgig2_031582 [Carnegiea gigantea]